MHGCAGVHWGMSKLLVTTSHAALNAPQLGVGPQGPLPCPCWAVSWLDLMWSLCRQPQLLRVHTCNNHDSCSEDSISQDSSLSSGPSPFSASSCTIVLGLDPVIALFMQQCEDCLGSWDMEKKVCHQGRYHCL